MKIIKCENGHYFDNDAYPSCPLCGAMPAAKSSEAEPEKKRGLFGKGRRAASSENGRAESRLTEEPLTVAMPHGNQSEQSPQPVPAAPAPAVPQPAAPAPAPAVPQPAAPAPAPAAPVPGLEESLREASSVAEGKTLSYFSAMTKAKEEKAAPETPAPAAPAYTPAPAYRPAPAYTPAPAYAPTAPAYAAAQPQASAASGTAVSGAAGSPADPVVGWLVAIAGPHLCRTFPVSVGLNSIGRSAGNRIVLDQDPAVSREKHAFVTYEPKTRQFFLRPGDSSGLTYLNGEYIFDTEKLAAGDLVELGQSRFYFLPLCGESFAWEDYLQ